MQSASLTSKREATTPMPLFSPRRGLGRTGFIASVLGAGDLADRSLPLATCIEQAAL